MRPMMRIGLAAAAAGLLAPAGRAAFVVAAEPNNTFATAQNVSSGFSLGFSPNIGRNGGVFDPPGSFVNTSTSIPNVTIGRSNGTPGLDYYRFTTTSPGTIILDIDDSPQGTNFDTEVFLFNAAGTPIVGNDDNGGDPGDNLDTDFGFVLNSRIQTGVLPAGDYVVGVAAFDSAFGTTPGTIIGDQIPQGGTYTLQISANAAVTAVPAPATVVVAGLGFTGLVGLIRRKKAAV